MIEIVDCHTHTFYSDGAAAVADNVARAAELGIATLAITDHLTLPHDMDPLCEVSVPSDRLTSLAADVSAARDAYKDVDVVFGFECDYYEGCEPNIASWAKGATYLLGSVHMLDGRWIDDVNDLSYWDEHGTEATWRRYFEVWAQACSSPAGFDSMAHPDLVMLLGRFPSEDERLRLYDDAAQSAKAAGVRIEVNTAGMVKPVRRMYPEPNLLERFCKAGVPITVGSDAHDPARVGDRIRDAYRFAYDAGYRHVDVPVSDGSWRRIDL